MDYFLYDRDHRHDTFNPFQVNIVFSYPPQTKENLKFLDAFRKRGPEMCENNFSPSKSLSPKKI